VWGIDPFERPYNQNVRGEGAKIGFVSKNKF
jgi:hypothetical protein